MTIALPWGYALKVTQTRIQTPPGRTNAVSTLAHRRHWQPLYVVADGSGEHFCAAKWRLPAHRAANLCVMDHILIFRAEGSAPVARISEGRTVRKFCHPGLVTCVPSGERALYVIESDSTYFELYLSPASIRRFCEQHVKGGRCATIEPFFAVDDRWLTGYFQMLRAEIETCGDGSRRVDTLLLGQAQQLLIRHLVRMHSDCRPARPSDADPPKPGCALRPHLLRRVTDYIRDNLAADVYLRDLAKLVDLSEAHFVRAFCAATGTTPYQHMLAERLRVGAELLRGDNVLTIAEVAQAAGFKSQSYFATKFRARYGITPTQFRRSRDA